VDEVEDEEVVAGDEAAVDLWAVGPAALSICMSEMDTS
jgi:hypothetical protein